MKDISNIKEMFQNGDLVRIIAIGDSLTQGWMVRKGYLDFLEEMLHQSYSLENLQIINRGIPGDTAEGGLYRLQDDVIDEKPDLTLIQFALNDAFLGYPVIKYKNNLRAIIEKIKNDTESCIMLITSVSLEGEDDYLAENYYSVMEELAVKYRTSIARVHSYWKNKIAAGVNRGSLVQSDRVHPNVKGYQLMAEAIMEVLQ